MAAPEVYAGFGAGKTEIGSDDLNSSEIMSGPNWFYTLTGNGQNKIGQGLSRYDGANTNWYCLDLLTKYHKKSALKQFHALTFYFRNSTDSSKGAIITATLPESFAYTIGGVYTNPIQIGGSDLVNAVIAEFTEGKTLSFNVDTSLVWQSPQRMEIVFKIPVFDDSGSGTNINYQEAIDLFGEAILPHVDRKGTYDSTPGPSIITALSYHAKGDAETIGADKLRNARTNAKDMATSRGDKGKAVDNIGEHLEDDGTKHWDRISVQVGGLLLLDWCVIKNLKVTFPNTKAQVLHDYRNRYRTSRKPYSDNSSMHSGYDYKVHLQPIQAELEVTVSTVMGMTRAMFKSMLYQVEQDPNGNKSNTEKTQKVDSAALQLNSEASDNMELTISGAGPSELSLNGSATPLSSNSGLIEEINNLDSLKDVNIGG